VNQLARPVADHRARFTAAEFRHMALLGAFDDMKVELIDGELERMNPPMGGHATRQAMIIAQLWPVVGERLVGEVGIDLGNDSVVGCDAAVLHRPMAEQRMLEPAEVLLVIEVAETTIGRDLGLKRHKYAAAGIANYWVIDGAAAVVHVHSSPLDGEYEDVAVVQFNEPLAVPGTDAAIRLT
jgi:Uma2 family endonuclease